MTEDIAWPATSGPLVPRRLKLQVPSAHFVRAAYTKLTGWGPDVQSTRCGVRTVTTSRCKFAAALCRRDAVKAPKAPPELENTSVCTQETLYRDRALVVRGMS
jgi:hypothetical protein